MKHELSLTLLLSFFTFISTTTLANKSSVQHSYTEYQNVKILIDSCNYYFDQDKAKYTAFAQQFNEIDFSQLIDSNFRKVIYDRTVFLKKHFNYSEAISILKNASVIARKNKDTLSLAYLHKWLSTHYFHLDEIDSTSAQLDSAFHYFEYLHNQAELGIIAIRMSRVAFHQGKFENAIKNSFKAIELHKAAGDEAKMAISYLQLGNTYLYLSNHIGALKYFDLAGILFKKTENQYGYAEAISNSGLVDIKTKKYRKGINKQFRALNFFIEEDYAIDAGTVYHFIVEGYFGLQEYDSSSYYNSLARVEFEKSNYQRGFCQAYLNDATLFFVKGEYKKALDSAQKCFDIATKNSFNKLLEESNFELYRIYKKLDMQSKSFQHIEQYVNLKDSLNFNPFALQSEAMKYQLAAEEAQLYRKIAEEKAQLEFEKGEKREQQLINTVVITILILIILFITFYHLIRNRKLNKNLRKQSEQLSEDLKVKESLLSEIHHRVKNNLQVINSMLSLQNQYVTDESLKKIFEDCKGRIISMSLIHESLYRKQDFKEALFSKYIEELLPQLISTYGTDANKIQLSVDTEPIKLSLEDSLPCGLLINEIVSNSLKYGFPDGREGNIRIELKQIKGDVHLTVGDDGVGLKEDKPYQSEDSFGFLLIETLANQLGADLSICTKNGFVYHIKWPNQTVAA